MTTTRTSPSMSSPTECSLDASLATSGWLTPEGFDTSCLANNHPFTVEGWIWFAFPGASHALVERPELALGLYEDGHLYARRHPLESPLVSQRKLHMETWSHLGLTFDGRELILFLNGKRDAKALIGGQRSRHGNMARWVDSLIARANNSEDIAELRIWDDAWPTERMQEAPRTGVTSRAGLVADVFCVS